MKKRTFISCLLVFAAACNLWAAESHVIEFLITGGGTALKQKARQDMETNAVKLLTMMSEAMDNSQPLNFKGIGITKDAQATILKMWGHVPMKVWDDDGEVPLVEENLLKIGSLNSYQIRNIPMRVFPEETPGESKYSEVAINFTPDGKIEDFNITIDKEQYKQMMKQAQSISVQTEENMNMVAHWMDQLKSAYESKDREYLERLFDNDALIITGVRKTNRTGKETEFKKKEDYEYSIKTKAEYLKKLQKVFDHNKVIKVDFIDQEYACYKGTMIEDKYGEYTPRYYQVWCTQEWKATNYEDVGRLYVLWDFKNPEQPLILVRAWTKPDDDREFNITDFKLAL